MSIPSFRFHKDLEEAALTCYFNILHAATSISTYQFVHQMVLKQFDHTWPLRSANHNALQRTGSRLMLPQIKRRKLHQRQIHVPCRKKQSVVALRFVETEALPRHEGKATWSMTYLILKSLWHFGALQHLWYKTMLSIELEPPKN